MEEETRKAVEEARTSLAKIIENAPTFDKAMKKLVGKDVKVVNVNRKPHGHRDRETPLKFEACFEDYALVSYAWILNEAIRVHGIHKFGTPVIYHLYDKRLRIFYEE